MTITRAHSIVRSALLGQERSLKALVSAFVTWDGHLYRSYASKRLAQRNAANRPW